MKEIEILVEVYSSIDEVKEILNVSEEIGMGKPELYCKKK